MPRINENDAARRLQAWRDKMAKKYRHDVTFYKDIFGTPIPIGGVLKFL